MKQGKTTEVKIMYNFIFLLSLSSNTLKYTDMKKTPAQSAHTIRPWQNSMPKALQTIF